MLDYSESDFSIRLHPDQSGAMAKSIFTAEYRQFLGLLRETRESAGVTQAELASKLGQTQSLVSKFERGEIRLDVIQLRSICRLVGTTLPSFVAALERRLSKKG